MSALLYRLGHFCVRHHRAVLAVWAVIFIALIALTAVIGKPTNSNVTLDGTGSTENAVIVDGRLTKISDDLQWEYSHEDWMAPWRITGGPVAVTFHPEHLRRSVTQLGLVASRTHQCFGHWSGRVRDESGEWVRLDGLVGWAEDVRNRW